MDSKDLNKSIPTDLEEDALDSVSGGLISIILTDPGDGDHDDTDQKGSSVVNGNILW